VALDTPEALKGSVQQDAAVEIHLDSASGDRWLRFPPGNIAEVLRQVLAQAESEGCRVSAVNTLQPSLEEAFIELTGLSAEVIRAEKGGR
jgi:ABC-2 type transport system ATP-binding protein